MLINNNDTYQRETSSERPIRQPLSTLRATILEFLSAGFQKSDATLSIIHVLYLVLKKKQKQKQKQNNKTNKKGRKKERHI